MHISTRSERLHAQASMDTQAGSSPTITLASCLQYYVQPEMLTSSASWVCSNCQCAQPAMKQMSILRLPPVLCLHVKVGWYVVKKLLLCRDVRRHDPV